MRYEVTWGDESKVVDAPNRKDAWALFCDAHEQARKFPNAFQRTIKAVDGDDTELEGDDELEVTSPVIDESAADAIDAISRMRSVEKLQEIVDTEPRITVVEAAKRRLESLHGDNT